MRISKMVRIGNIEIGGGNPITIQSMTNTDTKNVDETVEQINRLVQAGCEIVRVSLPDLESAKSVRQIKARTSVPLV
ncbi:MAG TPA: flavodoxin-dependent (E)-4-hydroxy-3-methylbut-2-enyl-diphosphate synthase, partial [Fervidobacterium sp.]|nr:flavodoxin-dependent (E)-4-hydroxy-3-methylbut-2-enyl-diphosphate synthase [Fervidobacterium sp.]